MSRSRVIDVVGDFGPVAKEETVETKVVDDSCGMSFDMSGIHAVDQSNKQNNAMMMVKK
jgi:hypothetical protein